MKRQEVEIAGFSWSAWLIFITWVVTVLFVLTDIRGELVELNTELSRLDMLELIVDSVKYQIIIN